MASPVHGFVERFAAARRDAGSAVLEGFHPLKHALRFGADIRDVAVLEGVPQSQLPPELADVPPQRVRSVPDEVFDRLVPTRPPLALVAVAARPPTTSLHVLEAPGHVVVLERPTHAGNVGAVVRVAAAAGAGGVLVIGGVDPWRPAAIRGGAGLQFALPVTGTSEPLHTDRPVIAFDPDGVDLDIADLPGDAILTFGTERSGLSSTLRGRADLVVRIPMRPGVSSLNLATSVAVALYVAASRSGFPAQPSTDPGLR